MASEESVIAGGCLAVIAAAVIGALFTGWILMICWGAIVSIFGLDLSTLGYWQAVLAGIVINLLIGLFSRQ